MKQKNNVIHKIGSILLVLLVAAVGALPYLLFRDQIQSIAGLGYIGLFVSCVLTNASVCLPASGIAFTLAAATALNPLLCALIGGLGTSVGELVGYLLGRFGRRNIENIELFSKIEYGITRYGYLAVFGLAFLPLPIFDLAGIAAGTVKLSPGKFFIVCTAGKISKMFLYVFILSRYLPI